MSNKHEELVLYVGDTIHDAIACEFDRQKDEFDFDTESNEVPYGDTYVNEGEYITDESEEQFRKSFDESMTFEKTMQILKDNEEFKEALFGIAKYISQNRGL